MQVNMMAKKTVADGAPRATNAAEIEYAIKPLAPDTWDAYARLIERNSGLFGGCWCTWFHLHPEPPERKELGNREFKKKLVEAGQTHAALVFDADEAIAWAQFGTVTELPNIHHRKQWEAETEQRPDYRITCLFVDKRYRGKGLTAIAVRGALSLIARQGGGLVEAYPHDLTAKKKAGKKTSSSFLYNATRTMYEREGFTYVRSKGQGNCVMSLTVAPI
jgi:GNAT superfamily N-acetyltransferase